MTHLKLALAGGLSAALLSVGAVMANQHDHAHDHSWTESPWGAEDEIGAANRVTPEVVMEAAKLITTGKTYPLGIVIGSDTPAFPPRSMSVSILQPGQTSGGSLGPTQTTYNDDIFMGWLGIGSQIDGLGHIGEGDIFYNGFKASEFAQTGGLTRLGVEKIPPIVARGVMLNMADFYGFDMLEEGTAYTREDIIAAAEQQEVELRENDVVLFHSGWMTLLEEGGDPVRFGSVEPGLGKTGAEYLAELGVIAVGGDTWGLEAVPFEEGVGVFEVHQILLAQNGIYILENMNTSVLVEDDVNEFMFVLGAARIEGAVQMMVNPVAIR